MYALKNTAPKYIKQKMIEPKGEIDIIVIIVGNVNILLSVIGRTSRPNKISKDIETGTTQLQGLVPPYLCVVPFTSYQC